MGQVKREGRKKAKKTVTCKSRFSEKVTTTKNTKLGLNLSTACG